MWVLPPKQGAPMRTNQGPLTLTNQGAPVLTNQGPLMLSLSKHARRPHRSIVPSRRIFRCSCITP